MFLNKLFKIALYTIVGILLFFAALLAFLVITMNFGIPWQLVLGVVCFIALLYGVTRLNLKYGALFNRFSSSGSTNYTYSSNQPSSFNYNDHNSYDYFKSSSNTYGSEKKPWTSYDPWNHNGTTWVSGNSIYNSHEGMVGSIDKKGNIYNSNGNYIGKK